MDQVFDVAIIGGGINGCGCAADAAMRGLSVLLCEEDDLASKTSSSSSKLIHGGLRYLEQYHFSLVKKALDERQRLLTLAPHLIRPLPFVIPHQYAARPLWLLRAGLFLYDHLSRLNRLPSSQFIRRNKNEAYFTPLKETYRTGFRYFDCTADDARLTIANALQAKKNGATILTQTKVTHAKALNGQWKITLKPKFSSTLQVRAKSLINAAGPWVKNINQQSNIPMQYHISLVRGSHLIVPQMYEGEHAYLLQNGDKRVVFAIPYFGNTLIGTTDVLHKESLNQIHIEKEETAYLLQLIGEYFNRPLVEQDILHTWSGLRTLLTETGQTPSTLSRDYAFNYTQEPAPAVTIYSGKITTYRQLASEAVDQLKHIFPNLEHSKTESTPLPGATLGEMSFNSYLTYARNKYHWLEQSILKRYLNIYGTQTEKILSGCTQMNDLGIKFGANLYQSEVDYLIQEEWAYNIDDILWRRTKLGLSMTKTEQQRLDEYLKNNS